MRIYVVNESTVLTDAEVLNAMPAFTRQTYHVREWWGTTIETLIFGKPPVKDAWQIIIADDADQAGYLGYHDFTPGGRPIAYVYAKTTKDAGLSWTITTSHEMLEMMLDPWITEMMQVNDTQAYALELCDPCESDKFGYQIYAHNLPPVLVSDFVLPNWFIPGSPGQYDYKGHITKPLQILEGGYAYVWEDSTWSALDRHEFYTVEEFNQRHPGKTRLSRYARDRG